MNTRHILINGDCRKMSYIKDSSVQLIVTSPPYWQLKDYGVDRQIGFNDSYEEYINNLNVVWQECYRVLASGCRLCINVGDQFARASYYGRYKVVPIHTEIVRFCETLGFDYMGSIIWQKQTNMHTTGGQKIMGSYPYPRGGIVKMDYEYILLFKKNGEQPIVSFEKRQCSSITNEEWQQMFTSHWHVSGAKQDGHIAVFPEEIPRRLIKMFSFIGDTILDPFMGSGTTALAAAHLGRNSIGYEINPNFHNYYEQKFTNEVDVSIKYLEEKLQIDIKNMFCKLPYKFTDVRKLTSNVDIRNNTYGSVIEDFKATKYNDSTVLINHVRKESREMMIKTGICYLRAGESKGSLVVTPGFERMQYVLLHTAGEHCQLFRLKSKGTFQTWTRETLENYGFHPKNALYYIVLHFYGDNPIDVLQVPNLIEHNNTFRPRIKSINEFKLK